MAADSVYPEHEKRLHAVIEEMKRLQVKRAKIEEQVAVKKARLAEGNESLARFASFGTSGVATKKDDARWKRKYPKLQRQ
jgi:hypothetical protein